MDETDFVSSTEESGIDISDIEYGPGRVDGEDMFDIVKPEYESEMTL